MKYRFYYIDDNGLSGPDSARWVLRQKWYLMPIKNFDAPAEFCLDVPGAGLFTEAEWLAWGSRFKREPIGEIEAPMLPGFEITERTRWPGEK